jgi:hypothetical protein
MLPATTRWRNALSSCSALVNCPVQLACRVSSSTSVITTGCSITSAATAGATGLFRAAFFTSMGLGLALATVFACAALRALGRVAEFPLRLFARLGSFPRFLRLAMIDPLVCCATIQRSNSQPAVNRELSTDRSLSATALALFFLGRTARPRTRTR